MSQLFARIELGGFPNERSYESLHRFMDELNWHRQVSKWQLPYATYHATFKEEAPNVTSIATMLKAGVQSKVWPTAMVLVIRAADWAASGER